MEEENKVVEAEQPAEQPQPAQQPEDPNKFSLITFIMALVGLAVCFAPVGSVAGVILGALSAKRLKVSNPDRNPFKVFDKVSKPVSLVDLIAGIVATVCWTIYFAVLAILAIIAAVGAAAE